MNCEQPVTARARRRPSRSAVRRKSGLGVDLVVVHEGLALEGHDEGEPANAAQQGCVDAVDAEALHMKQVGAKLAHGSVHPRERACCADWPLPRPHRGSRGSMEDEAADAKSADQLVFWQTVSRRPSGPDLHLVTRVEEAPPEAVGEDLDAADVRRERARQARRCASASSRPPPQDRAVQLLERVDVAVEGEELLLAEPQASSLRPARRGILGEAARVALPRRRRRPAERGTRRGRVSRDALPRPPRPREHRAPSPRRPRGRTAPAGAGARKMDEPSRSASVSATLPRKWTLCETPSSSASDRSADVNRPSPATVRRQPRCGSPLCAQARRPTSGSFSGSSRCIMRTLRASRAAAGRSATPLRMSTQGSPMPCATNPLIAICSARQRRMRALSGFGIRRPRRSGKCRVDTRGARCHGQAANAASLRSRHVHVHEPDPALSRKRSGHLRGRCRSSVSDPLAELATHAVRVTADDADAVPSRRKLAADDTDVALDACEGVAPHDVHDLELFRHVAGSRAQSRSSRA